VQDIINTTASSAASIQVADVTFHELESRFWALESLHERQVIALTRG
jgi:hypothetical protein